MRIPDEDARIYIFEYFFLRGAPELQLGLVGREDHDEGLRSTACDLAVSHQRVQS